jgi:hypothetical protein
MSKRSGRLSWKKWRNPVGIVPPPDSLPPWTREATLSSDSPIPGPVIGLACWTPECEGLGKLDGTKYLPFRLQVVKVYETTPTAIAG